MERASTDCLSNAGYTKIIPIPIRFLIPLGTTGTYNKARTNGNDGPNIGSEMSERMVVVGEQSLSCLPLPTRRIFSEIVTRSDIDAGLRAAVPR